MFPGCQTQNFCLDDKRNPVMVEPNKKSEAFSVCPTGLVLGDGFSYRILQNNGDA